MPKCDVVTRGVRCGRDVLAKGKCVRHYKAIEIRGQNPDDLIEPRFEGGSVAFSIKLPVTLAESIRKAAAGLFGKPKGKRNGAVPRWLRLAAEEKLKRDRSTQDD